MAVHHAPPIVINASLVSPAREETVFYQDEHGIRITNSRLIVRNCTYAMANLSSIQVEDPRYLGLVRRPWTPWGIASLLLSIFAAVLAYNDEMALVPLLATLGVGTFGLWFASLMKPRARVYEYNLYMWNASGKARIITTRDAQHFNRVVQAINEAVIRRG
jgi:Family of unknown function (DUF6232)